ncbi:glycosyltransferase [Microbacterium sp. Mcb102]|uniref:glycosyltransferase family protein n=1 Tax=Microbacterium sp. Mcb102 TaxID=2926012 RepID=UPI0021C6E734|nr:glycosyltransferase [Microbacterium sp. Mcb102]
MKQAFEAIGFEVLVVSGYSRERRRRIAEVKRRIRAGDQPAFVYSESSTMPSALTDPRHIPLRPFMDERFLRWCRTRGMRVGLYYRDVYWRFPEYVQNVGRLLSTATKTLYRADLRGYRSAVDVLYLQSLRMAEHLPVANRGQVRTLPPGAERVEVGSPVSGPVSLLYVGGIGDAYYRMHEAFRGVGLAADARLVVCTRESEWRDVEAGYASVRGPESQVVHRSGEQLDELYADAHLGVLFMEPVAYRDFVLPFKLFEYVGRGKPVVATEGTLVGDFVTEHGIGWAVPYRAESLAELLDRLDADPEELHAMQERVRVLRESHSWEARAQQVADDLTHHVA